MVLGGGGATVGPLLLELLELELEELLDPGGEPHGSIATVCVSVLFGITISFDPGGMVVAPDCETTAASEQEVTAIVNGLCCLGMTTVLTPGAWRAALTGSLELEEPPLLPQADSAPADAVLKTRTVRQRLVGILMLSSGLLLDRSRGQIMRIPALAVFRCRSYPITWRR